MRQWLKITLLICLLAVPGMAAADENTSSAVSAIDKMCQLSGGNETDNSTQIKLFQVAVPCFENLVNNMVQTSVYAFTQYLQDIIYATLALYVILYGARVSLGMHTGEQIKREFIVQLLKVAFVGWLLFSYGILDIYNLVLASYYDLIGIVMQNANLGDCSGGATFSFSIGSSNNSTGPIWTTLDCMLSNFLGWNKTNGYGSQYKNVPLFLGIVFSKFLPANGFIIGGILFSALWALMSGFFRLAFVYILSMIALVLLFSIAPMIIPLILFKRTYQYFEGWYKLVISMVLQPVILFAFFAFVASLLTQTINDMENVFNKMKPAFQTSGVSTTGDTNAYHQIFDAFGNIAQNLDADTLLNAIVTFVMAYLLISFINYVSQMALELAGSGTAPTLGSMSSDMFGVFK